MLSIKRILFGLLFLNSTVLLLYYRFLNKGLSAYKVSKNHEIENILIQENLPLEDTSGVSAALITTTSFVHTIPSDDILDKEAMKKKFEELVSLEDKEKFIAQNKERLEEIQKELDMWQQTLQVQKASQELENEQESDTDQVELFIKNLQDTVIEKSNQPVEVETKKRNETFIDISLLQALDVYQKIDSKYFDRTSQSKQNYRSNLYSLHNDGSYCEKVDLHYLQNPEELLKNKNFFTDYQLQSLPREKIIEYGNDTMPQIYYDMPPMRRKNYHLDIHINNFFVNHTGIHEYQKIGKHFLCMTQMYNHIPGNGGLIRRDKVLDMVALYEQKYIDEPQCFTRDMFILPFYRLYNETECKYFFSLINSEEYRQSLEENPHLYIIKDANDLPETKKSFLLNDEEAGFLNEQYQNGLECGKVNQTHIAQQYISNPLLLNNNTKFTIRAYMLVASTNPPIVYYHDGYLNVSNMESKAADDQFLDYSELNKYLTNSKRVTDNNWLDNYLRPQLQQVFVHLMQMASIGFWNQSNVYELFGLDFFMDENLHLWFIGANASPVLTGINDSMIGQMLLDLFDIQFSYYRSRMLRVLDVLNRMNEEVNELQEKNIPKWREEYLVATKNKLEPNFEINNSTFVLILDESREKEEAYFGHVSIECIC